MYDILFKNGRILDGTGNPWFKADLAVANQRIVALGRHLTRGAERVIDASGLTISPGFIDLHTHTDRTIIQNNRATSSVMAGVTTEGVGNCGSSAYCFSEEYLETLRNRARGIEIDWTDLKGYRETLEENRIGINVAPFVGHNTVRASVMGPEGSGGERIVPSDAEMGEIKRMLEEAMLQGAFGMTTGLWYAPGRNALTDEIVELCQVVAKHGGVYMSHIRGEADVLIESVREFIETCERADIRGCISHHKAMGPQNWGKPSETVRLLEKALRRGVEVMCDQYPWNYSSAANLGRWFISGWGRNRGREGHYVPDPLDLETFLRDLGDPDLWARMKGEAQERYDVEVAENEVRRRAMGRHNIKPSEIVDPRSFEYITHSKTHPEVVGKRFFEVAEALGMDDHWEAMRRVLLNDGGHTFTGGGGMSDEDIATILRFRACAVSTDSSTRDEPSNILRPAHPRNYGSFAKVLGRYARVERVLSLEEAVRKMTSLPAGFLGLTDRGIIRPGAWADLTLFDPEEIENRSTFGEPDRYPAGIRCVLVNGEMAAENGRRTDSLSGRVLMHKNAT